MSAAEKAPEYEVVDGYLVRIDDGEIVDIVDPSAQTPGGRFHVYDQHSAEWVLEKLSRHDADLAALAARKVALLANLEMMENETLRRREYLLFRFGKELEQFARQQLAGGKKKTWTTPFGSVAFRKSEGSVKIVNQTVAALWAKERGLPVHIEEIVMASEIKEAVFNQLEQDKLKGNTGRFHGVLEIVPAGEKVTIKTGVE